jgi:hypothetical protein
VVTPIAFSEEQVCGQKFLLRLSLREHDLWKRKRAVIASASLAQPKSGDMAVTSVSKSLRCRLLSITGGTNLVMYHISREG